MMKNLAYLVPPVASSVETASASEIAPSDHLKNLRKSQSRNIGKNL
jgi:hypothetical protein